MSGKKKTVKIKGAKGDITWTSSNENVATVSKSGKKVKITATGAGKAKIIARNKGKSYKVTVKVNGVKNPGNSIAIGRSVKLKTSGIGKRITWKSSNSGIVSINKKTGVIVANRPGRVKITAKGRKGKATITLTIPANAPVNPKPSNPSTGGTGGGSSSSQSGSEDNLPYNTYEEYLEWLEQERSKYPIVSNNPKYHYDITVLNDGTVDGHDSVIYNNPNLEDTVHLGALLYIKTDAPTSYCYIQPGIENKPTYTFLIDGEYCKDASINYVHPMTNAHYESNGRAVGGDIVRINVKTPGVHTIEIVEDLDNSIWDGEALTYHLKSYTKTGVSIKINFHDYDAEREQWVAETVAKYTSPEMTDRQKAEALRAYFLSNRFHHYQIVTDRNGIEPSSTHYISYINFTPFWVSGIGDCIESNRMFQSTLEKAGVTYKGAGRGSHAYTLVYLDGEWVNMDVAKGPYNLFYDMLTYVN